MAYRTIGDTIVEWEDSQSLVFTMTQLTGPRGRREPQSITVNLTGLRQGFTDEFLKALKEHLMGRCNQVKLVSVRTEQTVLLTLLTQIIALRLFNTKVKVIDEGFLLCLAAEKKNFTKNQLKYLKKSFSTDPHSPLFAKGLLANDIPTHTNKKGPHGQQIDNILAKALTRSAAGHILDVCDTAYAAGTMDIGDYSFVHLAFAVFSRPESYRQIRVSDLKISTSAPSCIYILTSKTGEKYPSKISYHINEPLGVLLMKQRQHVIEKYGHLVAKEDIEKLALFPARQMQKDNSRWKSNYANEHFGMYKDGSSFNTAYPEGIKKQFFNDDRLTLSANALRHTVGTLLAQAGASAKAIQSVLKHASPDVCRAYVDIAFHCLMEELSEALRPAFVAHLPALMNFRSKDDPTPLEKQVLSWESDTGKLEKAGECGKSIACARAPIVCYGCIRFTPCWDADHSINLRIVEKEIEETNKLGKPFQHKADSARSARNQIILVMNAADRYREAIRDGAQK